MPIDPQRWQRLSLWLDQVLDVPTGQRQAWLDDLATRDAPLAADLRAMLAGSPVSAGARLLHGTAPALAPSSWAGRRIGAYTLLEPLGEGGMGTVWLAERSDGRFESRAAVKLLHAGLVQRALAERFRREGAILARLSHPHIARLVDAGLTEEGQPYLVLEHVAGERIDRWCDERRLPLRSRVMLFAQVLQAVQHAHVQLVVHRDLKPANVMVDAEGAVKLLDFGIAKLLDHNVQAAEATELTRNSGRVLTPLYAAPEQMRGDAVTTATDVYALGLLLYLLLTGQHPRVDAQGKQVAGDASLPLASRVVDDSAEERQAAAAERGMTPVKLAHALAGDLDNILAKALRAEPAERYATVAAFAGDLQRHLDGHTVSARPDSLAYRASRFAGRHKLGVGLASAALAVIVGTAVVADQQRRAAERERDLATRQRVATEAMAGFLEELLGQTSEPGQASDPAARIDLAQRRAEQLFFDVPEVVLRLNGLFHGLNTTLERHDAKQRNVEAIEAAARQISEPVARAEAWCGPEAEMSDAESIARIERGLALLPAGEGSRGVRAKCLFHRASHLRDSGRYADALRDYDASYGAAPTLQRRMLEASYLRIKGVTLNEMGQPHAGDRAFSQLAELMRAQGRDRSITMVLDLDWRAILHWRMGRPREALSFVAQAAELSKPGGRAAASSPLMTALLGRMLLDLDRPDEALRHLERAQLRDGRLVPVVHRAWELVATAHRLRGDLDAAVAVLERDLAEARSQGQPVRDAINRVGLAEALLARREADRALAVLAEFDAGPEILTFRWEALWLRARAHNMAGQLTQAEAAARATIAEASRRAPPEGRSALHGHAFIELARALSAQGRAGEARVAAARAATELTDSLGPEHSATRAATALARP